ncbi:hypothetical protein [Cupriavidus plantarum]|uniref:hypothetical protein n=1 Tax=Cupriavidus plantarum TaxID=942865 RepID=UPI00339D705F
MDRQAPVAASPTQAHSRLVIGAVTLWTVSMVLVITFLFDTWPHEWLDDEQREPWFHAVVVIVLTLLAFFCSHLHHHVVHERERRAHAKDGDEREQKDERETRGEGIVFKVFGSWWGIAIVFVIPTAAYFGAHTLHSPLPEPAIFVMAVVAIYVAAEHYASLDKQREDLRWVTDELGKQVTSMQNALGARDGRTRIYAAYCQPPATGGHGGPIHAIYRSFDIDSEWLASGDWAAYMASPQTTSLVGALRSGDRRAVRIVTPPIASAVRDAVEAADRFHNFIGLLWHWLALHRFQVERAAAPEGGTFDFRAAIADTPHWVHAVDGKVLQIAGEYPHELRVKDMTFDMGDMAPRFAAWVREEIDTLCARGQDARAYLGTMLDGGATDADAIMERLGWPQWAMHAGTRYGIGQSPEELQPRFRGLIEAFQNIAGGTARG